MTNQTDTENKIKEENSSEGLENQQQDDQLKDSPPESSLPMALSKRLTS